jgi:hypothetical protein
MNITVRHATEHDFQAVASIFSEENRFHATLLPDLFQIAETIMSPEWFADLLADADTQLLVAQLDDKIERLGSKRESHPPLHKYLGFETTQRRMVRRIGRENP